MESFEDKVRLVAAWAKDALTIDQLAELFAEQAVRAASLQVLLADVMDVSTKQAELLREHVSSLKATATKAKLIRSIRDNEAALARFVQAGAELASKAAAEAASARAKAAADAKHDRPGGARDLKAKIRALWATGKYATRKLCAEQEWEAVGYPDYEQARRALQATPDPEPWPGKVAAQRKK